MARRVLLVFFLIMKSSLLYAAFEKSAFLGCEANSETIPRIEQRILLDKANEIPDFQVRNKTLYKCNIKFGNNIEAANNLILFRKVNKNAEFINYFFAKAYYAGGYFDKAHGAIKEEQLINPNDIDVQILLGKILIKKSEYDNAGNVFDTLYKQICTDRKVNISPDEVRFFPTEVDFFMEYFSLYIYKGNIADANQVLISGLRRNPSSQKLFNTAIQYSTNMVLEGVEDKLNLLPFCKNIVNKWNKSCRK